MLVLWFEKVGILGFEFFVVFKLDDIMVKIFDNVCDFLIKVWMLVVVCVNEESERFGEMVCFVGENYNIEVWDWCYYIEKVCKVEYDFDEIELKFYFQFDNIIDVVFNIVMCFFGIIFCELMDMLVYYLDVCVFEVLDVNGDYVGLFLGDYFVWFLKCFGVWMIVFCLQYKLDGNVILIIVNVMNFFKGVFGEVILFIFDDVCMFFYEFGYVLYGFLLDVIYLMIFGILVVCDFVEFFLQFYEYWLLELEVLFKFVVYYKIGEVMLVVFFDKLLVVVNFN